MSELVICLLTLAVVAGAQVVPSQTGYGQPTVFVKYQTDIEKAAHAGEWAKVHTLIAEKFGYNPYGDLGGDGAAAVGRLSPLEPDSIFFTDVKDLRPPTDFSGKVYGTAQSTYMSSSNDNGKVNKINGGYKVINDNGRVTAFSFNPNQ